VSTTESEAPVTWLTQDAYDKLQDEHDRLVANRPALAAEINARREEGDLKENGGYHAAKEEQGKQEARIRQLQDLLRVAMVGEAPKKVSDVRPGTVVTIQYGDDADDTEQFLLGSREIAAATDLTAYSPESPMGSAILGHRPGDKVTYTVPNGKAITVTITAIEPFTG
jgi:transcription elongation factor GreA